MPQLPHEPRPGAPVDGAVVAQLIRCVRAIWPRPSPTVRPQIEPGGTMLHAAPAGPKQAGSVAATIYPLQLTTEAPLGWEPPDEETLEEGEDPEDLVAPPFRCWVKFGTLDGSIPTNIDEPIEIANDITSSRARRVWLKASWAGELSSNGTPLWTALAVEFTDPASTSLTPAIPAAAPVNTVGSPGVAGVGNQDYYLLPLGIMRVVVTGAGTTENPYVRTLSLVNDDQGSWRTRFAGNLTTYVAADAPENPPSVTQTGSFTFYRNATQ